MPALKQDLASVDGRISTLEKIAQDIENAPDLSAIKAAMRELCALIQRELEDSNLPL